MRLETYSLYWDCGQKLCSAGQSVNAMFYCDPIKHLLALIHNVRLEYREIALSAFQFPMPTSTYSKILTLK